MIISDLHIHSRYSRACSKNINIENLEKYARIKGLNLLGTGDFQHPLWIKELKEKLTEDDQGILRTKTGFPFIWQTEISLMYSQDGKGRRVHYVILAPNKNVVEQIIENLRKRGRLDYDGRPIFGFSSIELAEMMQNISNKIEIIPAHCMTPYFGLYGSKTGFDSVEECFKEKSKFIHAVETGMSADPCMLRRISNLDKYTLVSFSDLHSYFPWRIGREATVFDSKLSYSSIISAIRTKKGLKMTIETIPDYGRYHYDGHQKCDVCFKPEETKKHEGICPKCKKPLTIGVQYRVEELADRKEPKKDVDYKDLIPLTELIAFSCNIKQLSSKKVWEIYNILIKEFNSEINILLNVSLGDLKKVVDGKLASIIIKNREQKLKIHAGYDGVYGRLVNNDKIDKFKPVQKSLNEF